MTCDICCGIFNDDDMAIKNNATDMAICKDCLSGPNKIELGSYIKDLWQEIENQDKIIHPY